MNRVLNRLIIVTAVLTLVFGVCTWLFRDSEGNAEYYRGSNSVEFCEYIDIDLLKTDVRLIPYSGDRIKFEYTSMVPITVMKGDNRVVITESDEFVLSFMTGDSSRFVLDLYLPREEYRGITVYTASGDVYMGGVKSKTVSVVTKSGSITSENTRSAVKFVSGSGNILLDFDKVVAASSIETRSGNADLIFPKGSSVALSYETETGIFRSELISGSVRGSYMYSFNGGAELIGADIGSGIMTVSEK